MMGWDQKIPGPLVGLRLFRVIRPTFAGVIQIYRFFLISMQKNVCSLVEKCKPEPVVPLTVQRHLYEWTTSAQPASYAAHMRSRDGRHQNKNNPCVAKQSIHYRLEYFWFLSAQGSDLHKGL
ncbi:hypothetical protein D3C80_1884660 [compost metagenome]